MTKKLVTTAALAFLAANSAFAVPSFLGTWQGNPDNPAQEETILEGLLGGGIDVEFWKKDDNLSGDSWTISELCPDNAITYVALKWGGRGGGTQYFYAIDPAETLPVIFTKPAGLGELSHVTYWCGPTEAPDTGTTLTLLGAGLLAVGGLRKKLS
jgi:hypothetical protein